MKNVFKSCYALDRKCYEAYALTEDILMEHAAAGLANHIRAHFQKGASVLIVAGQGNNGADGIVLARQLHGEYEVRLHIPFALKSEMAYLQLERSTRLGVKCVEVLEDADVIVDALYGAGLNKALRPEAEHILQQLNAFNGYKIACDVPTGVSDSGSLPVVFMADTTVTMGARTEALYLDENKDAVGSVICADLGVSAKYYEEKSTTFLLEESDLKLPSRKQKNSHKGVLDMPQFFVEKKRAQRSLQERQRADMVQD